MSEPTREQEASLQRLAFLYDRLFVDQVADDLVVMAESVGEGTSYCVAFYIVNPDGRYIGKD